MDQSLTERLVAATRQEISRALAALCAEVGAAESSILLPADDTDLVFFASTNPALMQPDTPRVPISASFSGIAYRTGQTIAVADAASQSQHFKAVDERVATRTREFAAIPCADRSVLGVLTLMNRAAPATGPFTMPEIRRAEAVAREAAQAIAALPGLAGIALSGSGRAQALDPDLLADLAQLNDGEQRVVHALIGALMQNRDT